jgi:uncharacterized DUF497 family protein
MGGVCGVIRRYPMTAFEWDQAKAQNNLKKHKVSFDLARHVFLDPNHIAIQDRIKNSESRW